MIMKNIVRTTLFVCCTAAVSSQELFPEPTQRWTAQLFPDVELGSVEILRGNGVFMAPDGRTALVTTVGATVYAFDAYTGEQKWVYQAESVDGTSVTRSHSAVTFGPTGGYMAFSVVDNENSLNPTTRVIALDLDGNELWVSDTLDGTPSGDPQISSDGSYVFLTHNGMEQTTGYFTILDSNNTGVVFYSDFTPDAAFGPPGIFHSPVEGNYDAIDGGDLSEGTGNTNDMLMWSQTPKPSDVTIQNGFMYGFQFPRDFAGNSSDVSYFQLGNEIRDFQSITPPVITNDGLSAYWSVTRSGFRGWIPKQFSRARDVAAGFTRNEAFPGQPVWATPALSDDGPEPVVFCGTASTEFVRMNFDFSEQVVQPTSTNIMSKALIDSEGRAVYYVEMNGVVHQADFDTLGDIWNATVNFAVEGEMALTPNDDIVIVADTRGVITALQVAEIPETISPSELPSDMPSMAPSGEGATQSPIAAPVAPTAPTPTAGAAPTSPVAVPTSPGTTQAPAGAPTSAPVASAANQPMMAFAFMASAVAFLI